MLKGKQRGKETKDHVEMLSVLIKTDIVKDLTAVNRNIELKHDYEWVTRIVLIYQFHLKK